LDLLDYFRGQGREKAPGESNVDTRTLER